MKGTTPADEEIYRAIYAASIDGQCLNLSTIIAERCVTSYQHAWRRLRAGKVRGVRAESVGQGRWHPLRLYVTEEELCPNYIQLQLDLF